MTKFNSTTTLTVCIPAYNEAQNIERVLRAVLAQEQTEFELSEVLVYSDASTDHTVTTAQLVDGRRIKVIEGRERVGKAAALNHMFSLAKSDAVVLLDADSIMDSNQVLGKLVRCMHAHDASLVSGSSKPLPSKTFMQRLLTFGTTAWHDLIARTPNSDMYRCGGQLALLRRDLYAHITYPKTSADDVYPYIIAKERGLNYAYDLSAEVYYKLPATYRDFYRQQTRFLNADTSIKNIFGKAVVRKYYTIGPAAKLKEVLKVCVSHPVLTVCYIFMLMLPKLVVGVSKHDTGGLWAIAETTKDLV